MRANFNTFEFWENCIRKNMTVRGNIFIENEITKNTVYFHTVVFNKRNGIESIWGFVPNERMLLGYIQHSFLPEAFYKWIYANSNVSSIVPIKTAFAILKKAEISKVISKENAHAMKLQIRELEKMVSDSKHDLMKNLKKFAKEFNKQWFGDSEEFLYLNIFNNATDMGNFVLRANELTNNEEEFQRKTGLTNKQWIELCDNLINNEDNQIKFKNILTKNLSEII